MLVSCRELPYLFITNALLNIIEAICSLESSSRSFHKPREAQCHVAEDINLLTLAIDLSEPVFRVWRCLGLPSAQMATQSLPKSAFCSDILHYTHTHTRARARQLCCLQHQTRATGSPAAQHCRLLRPTEETALTTRSVLLTDNIKSSQRLISG